MQTCQITRIADVRVIHPHFSFQTRRERLNLCCEKVCTDVTVPALTTKEIKSFLEVR